MPRSGAPSKTNPRRRKAVTLSARPDRRARDFVVAFSLGAFDVAGSATVDDNGQQRRQYKKQIIRVGEFVKDDEFETLGFEVTPDTLTNWVEQFAAMSTNGVRIPVPGNHWNLDAENNHGFVTDMYTEGDGLYATIELIGEESIALASKNDVSIFSPAVFVDGAGNQYLRPILHVALTPVPVIPGLEPFEVVDKLTIAASQGNHTFKNVPVLRLADGGSNMTLKDIAAKLEIEGTEEMTEEELGTAIEAKIEELMSDDGDGQSQDEVDAAIAAARSEGIKVGKREARKPTKTDPMTIRLSRRAYKAELDALVTGAHITPAVRDQIEKTLIPTDDDALALSLADGGCDRIEALLEALKQNDPVKLGEQTAAQSVALSRTTPGDPDKPAPSDVSKGFLERTGGVPAKAG